jgi:phage terminase large subunit
VAFPQIFGDCNPGSSRHWIRQRAEKGALRLINAYHKDNLALYDKAGNITEEGKRRIGFLESTLTGLRRQRLLLGKWATAEGAVFDTFDPENVHVCVRSESEMKTWHLCMDEGFTNPAVILLCGDDSDGRRHVFREYYQRGALQADVIQAAVKLFKDFQCYMIAVDAAAAGLIAGLNGCGVNAVGGKGRIIDGIYALQNRLLVCRDGRPRLTIDPSCKETINEFESHVWQPDKPKDVPIDRDNHSIAALRYLEDVLAVPTGAVDSADNLYTGESEFAGEEIEFGQRLELR